MQSWSPLALASLKIGSVLENADGDLFILLRYPETFWNVSRRGERRGLLDKFSVRGMTDVDLLKLLIRNKEVEKRNGTVALTIHIPEVLESRMLAAQKSIGDERTLALILENHSPVTDVETSTGPGTWVVRFKERTA
jgi:hypothetical protein